METVYYIINISKRHGIERGGILCSSPSGNSLLYVQCFKNSRYKEERGLESSPNWDN